MCASKPLEGVATAVEALLQLLYRLLLVLAKSPCCFVANYKACLFKHRFQNVAHTTEEVLERYTNPKHLPILEAYILNTVLFMLCFI
jgi:hypothetical protein